MARFDIQSAGEGFAVIDSSDGRPVTGVMPFSLATVERDTMNLLAGDDGPVGLAFGIISDENEATL